MGIGAVIQKIFGAKRDGEGKPIKGLSADDKELESYLEEERRERVKKILFKKRNQRVKELLVGRPQDQLLKGDKKFKQKRDGKLLNGRSDMWK
jgi:hypothetical protein